MSAEYNKQIKSIEDPEKRAKVLFSALGLGWDIPNLEELNCWDSSA